MTPRSNGITRECGSEFHRQDALRSSWRQGCWGVCLRVRPATAGSLASPEDKLPSNPAARRTATRLGDGIRTHILLLSRWTEESWKSNPVIGPVSPLVFPMRSILSNDLI